MNVQLKLTNDKLSSLCATDVLTRNDVRMMRFLAELASETGAPLTETEELALVLYFAFLRDGSTCLVCDKKLAAQWQAKRDGLTAAQRMEGEEASEAESDDVKTVKRIVDAFLEKIPLAADALPHFIQENFPIVFEEGRLFARKFLNARNVIHESVDRLFIAGGTVETSAAEISAIQEKYKTDAFTLNDQQAEAIVRGQGQNLVITGGPGTGKTTVVFYLLLELLKKDDFKDRAIYLTAPSGKAADRLKESIDECIARLSDELRTSESVARLQQAESATIHRLLKYNPVRGSFTYDATHPFPETSVFVIDEASMIGVSLFAKLLSAIPKGARVYILGDKDQLPSVDAGAAFEEMLKLPQVTNVKLTTSNRFNSESRVGELALALQEGNDEAKMREVLQKVGNWKGFKTFDAVTKEKGVPDNLRLVLYPQLTCPAQKREELTARLKSWVKEFYTPTDERLRTLKSLDEVADVIRQGATLPEERQEKLREILNWSKAARILCAERKGVYGVDSINRIIDEQVGGGKGRLYNGQFLMITQNQHLLNLFNGDTGLVVRVGEEPYFMYEKSGVVSFCRLDLIPSDARERAFAMTVHKAQGSGYDHLLLFLPENEKSLLANRQILYTGLTRIQKGVLTVIGSPSVFKACCDNRIQRQTGLDLNNSGDE